MSKKYSGVRQSSRSNDWIAEIHDNHTKDIITVGRYATVEEAARAYDEAARLLYGYVVKPNFGVPDPANDPPSQRPSLLLNEVRAKLRRRYLLHNHELLFADAHWLATFPTF